jgi:hypothetical protein
MPYPKWDGSSLTPRKFVEKDDPLATFDEPLALYLRWTARQQEVCQGKVCYRLSHMDQHRERCVPNPAWNLCRAFDRCA